MCRGVHCFAFSAGHGKQRTIADMLNEVLGKPEVQATSDEDFIQKAISDYEVNIRGYEIAIGIMKAPPPDEGAKLVSLEILKPHDPAMVGIASIVAYVLTNGSYLVIGTDHLTQDKVSHMTPNIWGLAGLMDAVKMEINKKSADAAEKEEKPE